MNKGTEHITVCIVEDNQGDAYLLEELLISAGFSSRNINVYTSLKDAFEATLNSIADVVLLDLFLPDSSGVNTFIKAKSHFNNTPIIVMSGLSDTEIALTTVKEGAQDFLVKGNSDPNILVKSIHYAIERIKNVQQLVRSEEEYRLLFEASPLPIFMVDKALNVLQANPAFLNLYKYSADEADTLTLDKLLDKSESRTKFLDSIIKQKSKQYKHVTKDGNLLYVEQLSAKTTFQNKEVYTIIIKDETEKQLFEIEKDRLIAETLEDERGRFSRELHDGLAQHLVAMNFYVAQLSGISEESDAIVNGCQEILKTSLDQTRAMCYNLTPPELEKGLIAGLSAMFQRLTNITPIEFKMEVDSSITTDDLEDVDEYGLYRIIQEFVNNSIKHSKCSVISCQFFKGEELIIEVKDNGVGFDVNNVVKGLGLKNMEHRVLTAGIKSEFTSELGKGTTLTITVG